MQSFRQFLKEGRGTSLKEDVAIRLIGERCTEYLSQLKNNRCGYIYRGSGGGYEYAHINPSDYKRKSANTANYYTELIDQSWPVYGYPERSESLICTTKEQRADDYGTVYIMFPFDSTDIGVANMGDIWQSMPRVTSKLGLQNLSQFEDTIADFFFEIQSFSFTPDDGIAKEIDIPQDNWDEWESMKKFFRYFDENIAKDKETLQKFYNEFDSDMVDTYIIESFMNSEFNSIQSFMFNLFDPDNNGFELQNTNNFSYYDVDDREVWFSGRTIAVQRGQIHKIEKEFDIRVYTK